MYTKKCTLVQIPIKYFSRAQNLAQILTPYFTNHPFREFPTPPEWPHSLVTLTADPEFLSKELKRLITSTTRVTRKAKRALSGVFIEGTEASHHINNTRYAKS